MVIETVANQYSRTMLLGGEMSTAHEAKGDEWKADPLHFLHCLDYMAQVSTPGAAECYLMLAGVLTSM